MSMVTKAHAQLLTKFFLTKPSSAEDSVALATAKVKVKDHGHKHSLGISEPDL